MLNTTLINDTEITSQAKNTSGLVIRGRYVRTANNKPANNEKALHGKRVLFMLISIKNRE